MFRGWLVLGCAKAAQFNFEFTYYMHDAELPECYTPPDICPMSSWSFLNNDEVRISKCLDWLSAKCLVTADFESRTLSGSGCTAVGGRTVSIPSPFNALAHAGEYEYMAMVLTGVFWNYSCATADWWLELTDEGNDVCRDIDMDRAVSVCPQYVEANPLNRELLSLLEFDLTQYFHDFRPIIPKQTFILGNYAPECTVLGSHQNGPAISYKGTSIRFGRNTTTNLVEQFLPAGLKPAYQAVREGAVSIRALGTSFAFIHFVLLTFFMHIDC
eukprot:Gregarina_sp_Poly_1__4928@NODE_2614_length_1916_cov_182_600324_g1657_i0_p1_GENE_NODE_2614_length_1916_cov_182_600324_g1657_i0NODE_2614_length_1916_cov_182_600324_g1657_i0_p1_ORF_typecomplete_len271_score29_76_NODE_2614_length_1916_cov_182_600324_g1657_i04421254